MKICRTCKETKSLTDFHTRRNSVDGYRNECKLCFRFRAKTNRKLKGRSETPEQNRKWNLKSKYNISPEEYNLLLNKQNQVCAICHNMCITGRKLAVDHNHKTGKIRGLLCSECNNGIGKLKDDPELLKRAIVYLNIGDTE